MCISRYVAHRDKHGAAHPTCALSTDPVYIPFTCLFTMMYPVFPFVFHPLPHRATADRYRATRGKPSYCSWGKQSLETKILVETSGIGGQPLEMSLFRNTPVNPNSPILELSLHSAARRT